MSYNQIFNQHWTIYQKIIQDNYMGHREIYDMLQNFMQTRIRDCFSFLDIGCGDSQLISQYLEGSQIASYLGIDLSADALSIADKNLAQLNCDRALIHEDFDRAISQLLETGAGEFDVVFAGFSLHHVGESKKQDIMGKIYRLLRDRGIFLLIDVRREQQETREDYLNRYLSWVGQQWHSLTPEEFAIVKNHARTSDFPETREILESMSAPSGFRSCQCLLEDSYHSNILLAYQKE